MTRSIGGPVSWGPVIWMWSQSLASPVQARRRGHERTTGGGGVLSLQPCDRACIGRGLGPGLSRPTGLRSRPGLPGKEAAQTKGYADDLLESTILGCGSGDGSVLHRHNEPAVPHIL